MIIHRRRYKPLAIIAAVTGALCVIGAGGVTIAKFSASGSSQILPLPTAATIEHLKDSHIDRKLPEKNDKPQQSKQEEQPTNGTVRSENQTPGPHSSAPGNEKQSRDKDVDFGSGNTSQSAPEIQPVTITYTDAGFYPAEITVGKGDTVTFLNNSSRGIWPASDGYPDNSTYPAFNAGAAVPPGETWSFTFNEPGAWGYHDHLNPAFTGTVTVR